MNLVNLFLPARATPTCGGDALVAKLFNSNFSFFPSDEGIAFTPKRRGVAATCA